jgi:very-short-patch-repair endonuclease
MKDTLTNKDIDEIVRLYQTDIPSTHKLAEKFKTSHKKISTILKDNNIIINKKGGQLKNPIDISKIKSVKYISVEKKLVARCKKTNTIIDDPNNLSGNLTNHIIKLYGNVDIPTNTYQRKKYEVIHNKKWFEEYFDIIEIDKKLTRKCGLCDWETIDVDNKSGSFENHILYKHDMTIKDYLIKFPNEIKFHKKIKTERELNIKDNHTICSICSRKLKTISSKHLKTHNITLLEYKNKYPNSNTISNEYKKRLQIKYEQTLRFHEPKFTSKPQEEINEFLKSFNIETKLNNKKLLSGVEIDILIDDLKLGIEYNGLFYHTENMGKTSSFHLNKTKLMNNKGYKLIHIFEDEWLNNKELVKNKLTHLCGRNTNQLIGARKCKIISITQKEKNEFLDKHHIQGRDKSIISIGAFYGDELVAVMTFDNKRNMSNKSDGKSYELTRFATNINYRIPGIGDKLLKYFVREHSPSSIISFGDVRWVLDANNNFYTKLGFKLVNILRPNYRYYNSKIHKHKRLHKFGFGKNNLKKRYPDLDFSKTEKQLMTELGYDRIWDCGLFKYELKLNN